MGVKMEKLSLETSMNYLKPKIVESFKNKDYDALITQIKQYEAAKHLVDAVKMKRDVKNGRLS
jgi:hypothetical protein